MMIFLDAKVSVFSRRRGRRIRPFHGQADCAEATKERKVSILAYACRQYLKVNPQ